MTSSYRGYEYNVAGTRPCMKWLIAASCFSNDADWLDCGYARPRPFGEETTCSEEKKREKTHPRLIAYYEMSRFCGSLLRNVTSLWNKWHIGISPGLLLSRKGVAPRGYPWAGTFRARKPGSQYDARLSFRFVSSASVAIVNF